MRVNRIQKELGLDRLWLHKRFEADSSLDTILRVHLSLSFTNPTKVEAELWEAEEKGNGLFSTLVVMTLENTLCSWEDNSVGQRTNSSRVLTQSISGWFILWHSEQLMWGPSLFEKSTMLGTMEGKKKKKKTTSSNMNRLHWKSWSTRLGTGYPGKDLSMWSLRVEHNQK